MVGLAPANWLDWCILACAVLGLVSGLRHGPGRAVVAMIAAAAALALACHFAPRAAAAGEARWPLERHVAQFVGRALPLPDGAGQTPYSLASAQFLEQQLFGSAAAAYAVWVRAMLKGAPSLAAPTTATLGDYLDQAVAIRLLTVAAFGLVFLVADRLLLLVGRAVCLVVAPRAGATMSNAALAAAAGVVGMLVQVTAVLAVVAAVRVIPLFGGLTSAMHGSPWATALLQGLRRLLPLVGPWMGTWLAWISV